MKYLLVICCLLSFSAQAKKDSVLSGAYNWQQPAFQNNKISTAVLMEGKVQDFEWMQLSANTLFGGIEIANTVPIDQEILIISKSGAMFIRFGDSSFLLTANSVVVLMPGEKYYLSNFATSISHFYAMKYRRKVAGNDNKSHNNSFVKLWEKIPFKPNNKGGGRRDFFEQSTVLQKRFEMHVTTLKEGMKSHEPHTHRAEEIVLVIEGDTEMQIGEKFYSVQTGGFYYLGSNVLHAIKTTGAKSSTYFAIQFE